jgi:N-acetylmuramoyl-L-alanine amidase
MHDHDPKIHGGGGNWGPLGTPKKITLHWTAGSYRQLWDYYHFCIAYDPDTRTAKVYQTRSITLKGKHVRGRNTGNIGISLCGMGDVKDAKGKKIGVYEIAPAQLEMLAKLVAELQLKYGIDDSEVHDHAYYAHKDGYYPDRWDIGALLAPVKRKAAWYKDRIRRGLAETQYTRDVR